jgi:hypothetical protein
MHRSDLCVCPDGMCRDVVSASFCGLLHSPTGKYERAFPGRTLRVTMRMHACDEGLQNSP